MINRKNISIFLGLFAFLCCLLNAGMEGYEYLWTLPLLFSFLSLFFCKLFEYFKNNIVFNIFLFQAIIRYCIIPLLMSKGGYSGTGYLSFNGNLAIFYMCIELLFVFLILNLYMVRQGMNGYKKVFLIEPLKGTFVLYGLLAIVFIYIYSTGFFYKINFIWNLGEYVQNHFSNNSLDSTGYAGILFNPFKVIVALLLISIIWKSNVISQNKKKYWYLIIVILASLFMTGTSRLSIIRYVLPLLILITGFLNYKSSKRIVLIAIIALIPIILVASIAKFSRNDGIMTVNNFLNVSTLNAYFAGPGNIASGFDAYENSQGMSRILSLINDTFQNVPGISEYTIEKYKTNVVFNEQLNGIRGARDQIAPLSVTGVFHFGIIGGFFYAPLFILMALIWERASHVESFIGYRYVFISLAINFSLVFMLNIGSFYFSLISAFCFIYLPLFIINRAQLYMK